MLVDFEKAFDSISWDFIHTLLTFLNFWARCSPVDQGILYWYLFLFKYQWYLLFFFFKHLARGTTGRPLSPYLYLLCAEVLSIMLRENELVKGVKTKDEEFLLSQFADDTALCLDGSEEFFFMKLLECYPFLLRSLVWKSILKRHKLFGLGLVRIVIFVI